MIIYCEALKLYESLSLFHQTIVGISNQGFFQESPCMAVLFSGNYFRSTFSNDVASLFATLRTQVDYPISSTDYIQIVLDNDNSVASID
jgi:hypothetical protein